MKASELLGCIARVYDVDYTIDGCMIYVWDQKAPACVRFPVNRSAFAPDFKKTFSSFLRVHGISRSELAFELVESDQTIRIRGNWRAATFACTTAIRLADAGDYDSPLYWRANHELRETHDVMLDGFHLDEGDIVCAMDAFCSLVNRLSGSDEDVRFQYRGGSNVYLNWEPNQRVHIDRETAPLLFAAPGV